MPRAVPLLVNLGMNNHDVWRDESEVEFRERLRLIPNRIDHRHVRFQRDVTFIQPVSPYCKHVQRLIRGRYADTQGLDRTPRKSRNESTSLMLLDDAG